MIGRVIFASLVTLLNAASFLTDTNDTIGVDALIIGIDESSQNVNALSQHRLSDRRK